MKLTDAFVHLLPLQLLTHQGEEEKDPPPLALPFLFLLSSSSSQPLTPVYYFAPSQRLS